MYLIVINFHWSLFGAVSFFRDTYFPRFSELFNSSFDVVYLAPSFEKNLSIVNHTLPKAGCYSYHTLAVAYKLFGHVNAYDYAGYFFLNDDGVLDPLHLNEYDLSHGWHEPTRVYDPNVYWSWNLLNNELNERYPAAFQRAVDQLELIPHIERRCKLSDFNNHRRGLQDFFYVPAKDIDLFCELSSVFYKYRTFLEVAAPTIGWCISHSPIDTCNHHFWPNVTSCVYLHPVKLGEAFNQRLVMDHINRVNIKRVAPMGW